MTKFCFSYDVQGKSFSAFGADSTRASFEKWGFTRHNLQTFTYNNYFDINTKETFVLDFFSDPQVRTSFQTFDKTDKPVNLEQLRFTRVEAHLIPASVTNMNFFDPLYKSSLARENGEIRKCFDEQIDEFLVSDELRKLILSSESEFNEIFSLKDREEFLFLLLSHLVLGGYCCQYEDNLKPYLETTKHLYKDLLKVRKDANTGQLYVSSTVLKVTLHNGEGGIVFPGKSDNRQNFCYLIVDPESRHVIAWHHIWNL